MSLSLAFLTLGMLQNLWGRPSACGGLSGRPDGLSITYGGFSTVRGDFAGNESPCGPRAFRNPGSQKPGNSSVVARRFWLRTSDFSTSISFFVDVGAVSA